MGFVCVEQELQDITPVDIEYDARNWVKSVTSSLGTAAVV